MVNSETKTILSNLREGLGFDISITRNTTGKYKGVSSVKIWKISSPSSPSSPDQNQARNQAENSEDTLDSEDTYPHQAQIPSPENGENHAQKFGSEGSEGSEDIFRIEGGPTFIHAIITAVIFILMMRRITIDTQSKNTQVFLCYILPKQN